MEKTSPKSEVIAISLSDLPEDVEFKKNVCYPYFKDIFKVSEFKNQDLASRSDDPDKGVNKITMLEEYCGLPGVLGERIFAVMDINNDEYLEYREFMTGLIRIFCTNFDDKSKFVFQIYDFDGDDQISKDDIITILSALPVTTRIMTQEERIKKSETGGKYQQEGGGINQFGQRVALMEELYKTIDLCFGHKKKLNEEEFKKVNEEIASDTLLSVLNLFREKLPCSENFWRYKRNYDLHRKEIQNLEQSNAITSADSTKSGISIDTAGIMPEPSTQKKELASPRMGGITSLQQYSLKHAAEGFSIDGIKSNVKKLANDQPAGPGSPKGQNEYFAMRDTGFKNIEKQSLLSHVAGGQKFQVKEEAKVVSQERYCVCGLICAPENDVCDKCQGKDQIHIEGEIVKKQKKGNTFKAYWFVLLGKELYSYKSQGEAKHKEMLSLSGVFIKNEQEEESENGRTYYPFMLIFPNKRRIYYLKSQEEKDRWMAGIKKAIGYSHFFDFYDVQDTLGQGKYGVVKKGVHKQSGKEVAIKIIKKKDLPHKDKELLMREIDVLKQCQHKYIIQLEDIFENQDYWYIVIELIRGGDLFAFLEKRKFKLSEERASQIAHQIATALFYLHSFGIAHRDLKPENILAVNDDDKSDVKLVDFGLSKTFGPSETSTEAYGTLCYVAPEILLQKPYNKAVDLWSLGIVIHLMLSGTLPFDHKEDREIAKKTIYEEVSFSHPAWQQISPEAKELVSRLLEKDPEERISLELVLQHSWIIRGNKKLIQARRKSSATGDKLAQFVSYSQTNTEEPEESKDEKVQ